MVKGIREDKTRKLESEVSRAHSERKESLLDKQDIAIARYEEMCPHIRFRIEIREEGRRRNYIPLCMFKIENENRKMSKDEHDEISSDKVDDSPVYLSDYPERICDHYNPGATFPSSEKIKECEINPLSLEEKTI